MFDLLEKGLRQPDENDYMTAYSIEGHPELHVSHHYFRNLTPDQVEQVKGVLENHFGQKPLEANNVGFNKREMFGPQKDIGVLVNDELATSLDPDLKQKLNEVQPSRFAYRPHVTTSDKNNVAGKIKNFYFQRGNGETIFSTDAVPPKLEKNDMPKVNAKVEGIEVKRPQSGVSMTQSTNVASNMPATMPKVPVPPKPSAQTGKMNNMPTTAPLNKAEPDPLKYGLPAVNPADVIKPKTPPQKQGTLDYSEWKRPLYSNTGKAAPLHNPVQHSKGALTGTERSIGKSLEKGENGEPIAKCDSGYMAKSLQTLRKCMASKLTKADPSGENAMPVYTRD